MPEQPKHEMLVDLGGGRERKMPVDYPSNSRNAKKAPPEKKKPEPIEGLQVIQRKRGLASRMGKNFVSDDAGTVVSYVILEVLLPAAKNMIVDAGQQALERIFYGDVRPKRGTTDNRAGYINYQRAGESRRDTRSSGYQARAVHDFGQYILPSRALAMNVIEKLQEIIESYDVVSVSDLYDILGVTGDFTDNKWGWANLAAAEVKMTREGYILDLPDPKPLT